MTKQLVIIQSISDIITNSSSEVFLISDDFIDYFKKDNHIKIETINSLEDLNHEDLDFYRAVVESLPPFLYHHYSEADGLWPEYVKEHSKELSELIGYSMVDISNDFDCHEKFSSHAWSVCTFGESYY